MNDLVEDNLIKKINRLEKVQCPVSHFFADGLYVREMFIPVGTIAVGHNHLFEHICSVIKGKLLFVILGSDTHIYSAPTTFKATPGRKTVYALEDSIVQNIHPNPKNIRDHEALENAFVDKTGAWEQIDLQRKLMGQEFASDCRADFETIDYTQQQQAYIDLDEGFETALTVRNSQIEGQGFFATWPFPKKSYICPFILDGQATTAARFINHSPEPNAGLWKVTDNEIFLFAKKDILGCVSCDQGEELTLDYREVMLCHGEPLQALQSLR